MLADLPTDFPDDGREVTERRRIYRGRVFDFVRDHVRLRATDPEPVVREYLDHPGAVAVVALRGQPGAEEALLVRQYRHPVRARLWEIPAGLRDVEGEEPLRTAARELREEADAQARSWHVLADIVNSPGNSSEGLRIYLARDVSLTETAFDREHEESEIEPRWVSLDNAVAAVHAGRIHNSTAGIGILAAASARAAAWAVLRPADAPWQITGRLDGA